MFDPKIVEAMARAAREAWRDSAGLRTDTLDWNDIDDEEREDGIAIAQVHLTALCAIHPGVAAVLRGEAVAVPREEATEEMRRATWEAQYRHANLTRGLGHDHAAIAHATQTKLDSDEQRAQDRVAYHAMLAASPYAKEAARDE